MSQIQKDLAQSRSLRFPRFIDTLINELALIERRTKRAIVAHAIEQYVQATYPEMITKKEEE